MSCEEKWKQSRGFHVGKVRFITESVSVTMGEFKIK